MDSEIEEHKQEDQDEGMSLSEAKAIQNQLVHYNKKVCNDTDYN